jgi:hypothetical protein
MIFFLLGWLFGPFGGPVEGQVSRFLPCTVGLRVQYRSTREGRALAAIEERPRGQGRELHTCGSSAGRRGSKLEVTIEHLWRRECRLG